MLRDILDKGVNLFDKVTNVVMNYTEPEIRVREATNSQPWGPHPKLMDEIVRDTRHYMGCVEVMTMIWKRMLGEEDIHWRTIYKALVLLTYLINHGPDTVYKNAKEHIYDLRSLESFHYTDEKGKDQGINVRYKVKDLINLLDDFEKVTAERKKAEKMNAIRYQGVGSDGQSFGSSQGFGTSRGFGSSQNSFESNSRVVSEDYFTFPSNIAERAEYEPKVPDTRTKDPSNLQITNSGKINIKWKNSPTSPNATSKPSVMRRPSLENNDNMGQKSPEKGTEVVPDLLCFDDDSKSAVNKDSDDFTDFFSSSAQSSFTGNAQTNSNPPNSSNLDDTFGDFTRPTSANDSGVFSAFTMTPSPQSTANNGPKNNDILFDCFSANSPAHPVISNDSQSVDDIFGTLKPATTTPVHVNNTMAPKPAQNDFSLTSPPTTTKTDNLGGLWNDFGALNINPDCLLTSRKETKVQPSLSQLKTQKSTDTQPDLGIF